MPICKDLPSPMCPSCKFYEFNKSNGYPHNCKDAGSWTNGSKLGQNPPASTCKTYKSK